MFIRHLLPLCFAPIFHEKILHATDLFPKNVVHIFEFFNKNITIFYHTLNTYKNLLLFIFMEDVLGFFFKANVFAAQKLYSRSFQFFTNIDL